MQQLFYSLLVYIDKKRKCEIKYRTYIKGRVQYFSMQIIMNKYFL